MYLKKGAKIMANVIEIKKVIGKVGKKRLTWATMKGVDKWDIRVDETDKGGIRFTDEEMAQLEKLDVPTKIDTTKEIDKIDKYVIHEQIGKVGKFDLCAMSWSNKKVPTLDFTVLYKGNLMSVGFTESEMADLKKLITLARVQSGNKEPIGECLRNYDPSKVKSVGKTESKPTTTKTTTKATPTIVEPKKYTKGYEKFVDQFAEYRDSVKDEWKASAKLSHDIITDHLKEICESSAEYNQRCLLDYKNSASLMRYIQDKAYSTVECQTVETRAEYIEYLLQFVDEYIGSDDDKPKPKENKPKTTTSKRGRPKKSA